MLYCGSMAFYLLDYAEVHPAKVPPTSIQGQNGIHSSICRLMPFRPKYKPSASMGEMCIFHEVSRYTSLVTLRHGLQPGRPRQLHDISVPHEPSQPSCTVPIVPTCKHPGEQ